jgi:hypothetical protein
MAPLIPGGECDNRFYSPGPARVQPAPRNTGNADCSRSLHEPNERHHHSAGLRRRGSRCAIVLPGRWQRVAYRGRAAWRSWLLARLPRRRPAAAGGSSARHPLRPTRQRPLDAGERCRRASGGALRDAPPPTRGASGLGGGHALAARRADATFERVRASGDAEWRRQLQARGQAWVAAPGDEGACRAFYDTWFTPFFGNAAARARSRGSFCAGTAESRRNKVSPYSIGS